jgi:hypothetical protein
VVNESLVISQVQSVPECGLQTSRAFDLEGSAVEMRFGPPLDLNVGEVSLGMARGNSFLRLHVDADSAWTSMSIDTVYSDTPPISVTEITSMRLIHEDDELRWEVESATGTLIALESQPTPFDLNGLILGVFYAGDPGESATISGINAD